MGPVNTGLGAKVGDTIETGSTIGMRGLICGGVVTIGTGGLICGGVVTIGTRGLICGGVVTIGTGGLISGGLTVGETVTVGTT